MIVEDGTGVDGANSYVDAAYAAQYFTDRGQTWAGSDGDLVRGTDYVDGAFEWPGQRVEPLQSLAWPRKGVEFDGEPYPSNVVPDPVKQAVCEVAQAIAADVPEQQGTGAVKSQKVGTLEVEYFEPSGYEYPESGHAYGLNIGAIVGRFAAGESSGGAGMQKLVRV